MLTPVKSESLGRISVGAYIFLSKQRPSVPHVLEGGRSLPKPMQLGLNECIDLAEGGIAIMRTNP